MSYLPCREIAYARLIVAIVADPDLRGSQRSDAIDAIVDRMIDGPEPCEHPGLLYPACQAPGICRDPKTDVQCAVCAGVAFRYCGHCNTDVSVRDL
jgi:hypothetical protein